MSSHADAHAAATSPAGNARTWAWSLYDELVGPALDAARWTPERIPTPGGEVTCVEPDARIAVGAGEVALTVDPFTRTHDRVQGADNVKHLLLSTRTFDLSRGPAAFRVEMASVNHRGDPTDPRAGIVSFNLVDPDTGSGFVCDIADTGERVYAIHERLPGGGREPFLHVVDAPFVELGADHAALRQCEIVLDRTAGSIVWSVDGKLIYRAIAEVPPSVRLGFGLITMVPLRDGRSGSLSGQGMTGRWRGFACATPRVAEGASG